MNTKSSKVINYPGSKWKIAKKIVSKLPEHHSYLEPFFGSGALFFNKEKSNIETINDLDDNITNLFECIKKDPEKLARMIFLTPYAKTIYDQKYNDYIFGSDDLFEKALGFLVICNMSHGFRSNQSKVGFKIDVQGREKAYAVKTWNVLPEKMDLVANRLKEVQIENRPAEELIKRFNHSNVLIYLDPPYMLTERFGKQYSKELEVDEHESLLSCIVESKANIIISGYTNALYEKYLRDWHRKEIVAYNQNHNRKIEVIWSNCELKVPKQLSLI